MDHSYHTTERAGRVTYSAHFSGSFEICKHNFRLTLVSRCNECDLTLFQRENGFGKDEIGSSKLQPTFGGVTLLCFSVYLMLCKIEGANSKIGLFLTLIYVYCGAVVARTPLVTTCCDNSGYRRH
jgi:hypothetical protein